MRRRNVQDLFAGAGEQLGRQPAVGAAMVASPNAWATLQGVEVMRRGGNAVDAALAVSAALMVSTPHQCSPGGDAFWLIRPPGGPSVGINASGFAGHRADARALRSRGGMRIRSAASVTVPGVIDGWRLAHDRYGSMDLPVLVEPAAAAADMGLRVTPYLARQFRAAADVVGGQPEFAKAFFDSSHIPRVGQVVALPDLARTLRIVGDSPRAVYEGDLAARIARAVASEPGAIDESDLADFQAEWTTPLSGPYGDLEIHELGPNASGWLVLLAAGILRHLAKRSQAIERAHLAIEASKLAVIVRDAVLADPVAMVAEPEGFLDEAWLAEAAGQLELERANSAAALSRIAGLDRSIPVERPGGTAHFAVVDPGGLAVSCIQSVYLDFGTGIVPEGTGMTLQNRGDCFTLDDGHPNQLGPRRRPLHTLAPALATAGPDTALVFGAMGGDAQPQIHLQLLEALRVDPDPARATAEPRWFARRDGDGFEVALEERSGLAPLLVERGHRVRIVAPYDEVMGHAQVIQRGDGFLLGAADPRSDGLALGLD